MSSMLQKLNQQLEEQERVTAEIQQMLQRQVEQLQQQLSQQAHQPPQHPSPVPIKAQVRERHIQQYHSVKEKQSQPSPLQVQQQELQPPTRRASNLGDWRDGGSAPYSVARGAAVVDRNMAYFMDFNGRIYSYNLSEMRWNELPRCPYMYSGLEVVQGCLTSIGGLQSNKLLSMVTRQDKAWMEHFPPSDMTLLQ